MNPNEPIFTGKTSTVKRVAQELGIPHVDIPLSKLEEEFENQLPEWAVAKAKVNSIQRMQQLYTTCSQQRGNATVVDIIYDVRLARATFIVATDAANIMKLTLKELKECFILGDYILKEFPNPLIEERLKEL